MSEIAPGQVTVTGTAAAVEPGGTDAVRLILRNNSASVTAYLGGAGVTTSVGFPLGPGDGYEFPIRVRGGHLFAVCAQGQTVDLRWLAV